MARALGVAAAMSVVLAGIVAAQEPEPARKRADITYAGIEYNHVYFHGDIDPWQTAAFSLGNRGTHGTYIARVNYARRYSTDGAQVELDAYPRFTERLSGYVNVGYSSADIFPAWRSGAELFAVLPGAWETSAGYRQLRFGGPPVTLLTGSVGRYFGNSWISARPYVRVRDDGTTSSISAMGRRYFADADNYIGARVSAGSSPPERGDPSELTRTDAWSAAVLGSRTLRARIVGTWSIGVEHEKLSAATRRRIDLAAGLRFQL